MSVTEVLGRQLKARLLVNESKLILSVRLDSLNKSKGFTGFWLGTLSYCETVNGLELGRCSSYMEVALSYLAKMTI